MCPQEDLNTMVYGTSWTGELINMKVAMLHLNVSNGPIEANLQVLYRSILLAAQQGAQWIVTPETAVQGYFFAQKENTLDIEIQPASYLEIMRTLAVIHRLTIFLGCAEKDAKTGKYYNSCLVIGPDGEILGRHRKIRPLEVGAEAWAAKGEELTPIFCQNLMVGILICADSWYVEHAQRLQQHGAEVIIVPAAWPPGNCGPGDCWERCSRGSGLPVWVCNQTGNQGQLNFSKAESTVVVAGKTKLRYSGLQQAVLLFDWDDSRQDLLSSKFTVIAV